MKSVLETIIKELVDYPEQVDVGEVSSGSTVVMTIKVAKSDIGKVVGKSGKTVAAIRHIITSIGSKNKKKVHLSLDEEGPVN